MSNDSERMFSAKRSENLGGPKERGITFIEPVPQFQQQSGQQQSIFPSSAAERGAFDVGVTSPLPPWAGQKLPTTGVLYPPGQTSSTCLDRPPLGPTFSPTPNQGNQTVFSAGVATFLPLSERPLGSNGPFGAMPDLIRPFLAPYSLARNVYDIRPPNPGKLTIELNTYLTNNEIKTVTDICSDNYSSQDRNADVADQLREIVQKRNKQIKWITACGNMSTAQFCAGRDSALFAKYGDLNIAILKGYYVGGRIAPPSEDTPGAQLKDVKKLIQFREVTGRESEDPTAQVVRWVLFDQPMPRLGNFIEDDTWIDPLTSRVPIDYMTKTFRN
ncbi:uncharacterized protein LOC111246598 isoform X2 [Varroa destructor]|uniref:Uncharacterized protein n=1 Tax=Varroa destructor TaxID=109461 RepID=A0A7M7JHD9_VARDE|nr:uncharacterized protein LOC111246598 isoform X2 [Varroa destructor]XP_022652190.1 uncharacterized protein LOC111246598 isoform X2 [Varroa destructor]XP_022652191.1 uncharacterized protein LOC111246598 isoform X2 [Varroa destructor]